MARAHLYRPILDGAGNLLTGLTVRVLEPGTVTPITETLYSQDDEVGNTVLGNPHTVTSGVVSIYLDAPKRVRLGIRQGAGTESFYDDLDVLLPGGSGGGFRAGGGTGSVIGGDLHNPATADGTNSLVIGDDATGDGSNNTVVGKDAWAHSDSSNGVAVGDNANVRGADTTAVGSGSNTNAADGTAVGHNANTGDGIDATALGSQTQAESPRSTAVGKNAWVDTSSDRSTAVGASTVAKGQDNTVVGTDSTARSNSAGPVTSGTVVGVDAHVHDNEGTAVGANSSAGYHSTAVGTDAGADNDYTTAVGRAAYTQGTGSTAVGESALATSTSGTSGGNTALGQRTQAGSTSADNPSEADANRATAVGATANARSPYSTAVGFAAVIPGHEDPAQQATGATALGAQSGAMEAGATAVGSNAAAMGARSVAVGADSSSNADDHGVFKADQLEVVPSSASGAPTTLGLHDTVDGTKHVIGVTDVGITFDGVLYTPGFSLQTIYAGDLNEGPLVRPGLRVIADAAAKTLVAHIEQPSSGADIHIDVTRTNGGVTTTIGTIVITAGDFAGSATVNVACTKGDLIGFNCTQVGSDVPGGNVNLSVDFQ